MKFKNILLAIGLAIASVIQASAQFGFSAFSVNGTAVNAGTNYAIIPAEAAAEFNDSQGRPTPGMPIVTYVSVRASGIGEQNSVTLSALVSTNATVLTTNSYPGNTNTITGVFIGATNSVINTNYFAPNTWAVIHHQNVEPRFANEAQFILQVQLTNQIVFSNQPAMAIAVGDQIYSMVTAGVINVTTNLTPTASFSAPAVFAGQRRKPFLLILANSAGVGTNTIDTASALFVP